MGAVPIEAAPAHEEAPAIRTIAMQLKGLLAAEARKRWLVPVPKLTVARP